MTIFQKIAASSFAAVRSTLQRRQLALTIHEAILKDQELDIDGHQVLIEEARFMIHRETGLPEDSVGRGEVDRILADLKLRLIRKLDEEALAQVASSDSSEILTADGEDAAATEVLLIRVVLVVVLMKILIVVVVVVVVVLPASIQHLKDLLSIIFIYSFYSCLN